jgi:hypothetical protein
MTLQEGLTVRSIAHRSRAEISRNSERVYGRKVRWTGTALLFLFVREFFMHHNLVSAVFDNHSEAERAVSELRRLGVADSSLSVIAQHEGRTTTTSGDGEVTDDGHRSVLRGILGGGALGAGLGVAALAIPGVGPLAAAGAIAASAVPEAMAIGAAAGAVGGTLNEVLTKHGVSKEDAHYYGERIKSGGVFVSVDTGAGNVSAAEAQEVLYSCGGHSSTRARSETLA